MRSRSRTTKWNLFFHYVTIALAMFSGIVMVPLYLQFIPVSTYGAWLASGNILAWLTAVDPGLSIILQQRVGVAYGEKNTRVLSELLSGGLLISAFLAILVFVVGFFSSSYFTGWLKVESSIDVNMLERAYLVAVLGTSTMIFSYSLTAFNQGLQSSLGVGIVFVVVNIVAILLTIYLLYRSTGIMALAVGILLRGCGLTLGNAAYLLWRSRSEKIRFSFSLYGLSQLFHLMSYTFLSRGASLLAENIDGLVIARTLGTHSVSVFELTRKAPDVSRIFMERPAIAFMPALSHLAGSGEEKKQKAVLLRLLRMIIWLLGLTIAGFCVFNDDFVALWVGGDLFAGALINSLICLGLITTVLSNALSNICFALGNIKGNSRAMLVQSLLQIPLMILGSHYFGLAGIAAAPLLAALMVSAWYYPWIFTRLIHLDSNEVRSFQRELGIVFVLSLLLILSFSKALIHGWLAFVLVTLLFTTLYTCLLWFASLHFREEFSMLSDRLRGFSGKLQIMLR